MSRGLPEVPLDVTHAPSLRRFLVDVREQLKSIRGPQTPPAPPGKLTISVTAGVVQATLKPSPSATQSAVQYLLDVSTSKAFTAETTSTFYVIGTPPIISLGLGTGTFYLRCRAQYPNSNASVNVYWGTAGNPTPVTP